MAIKVVDKVFKHKVGDPVAKLVLLKLADFCDESGRSCFPSIRTIAFQTELSTRTVVSKLALLEKKKLIKIKRGGITHNNNYRVMIERLTENVEVVKRFHHVKDSHGGSEFDSTKVVNVAAHNHHRTTIESTIACSSVDIEYSEAIKTIEELEKQDPEFVPF